MLNQNNFQYFIKSFLYLISGILAMGAILDTISNSISLVSTNGAAIGTIGILFLWINLKNWVSKNKPYWGVGENRIRLNKPNFQINLFFMGLASALWIPTLFKEEVIKENNYSKTVVSPKIQAELEDIKKQNELIINYLGIKKIRENKVEYSQKESSNLRNKKNVEIDNDNQIYNFSNPVVKFKRDNITKLKLRNSELENIKQKEKFLITFSVNNDNNFPEELIINQGEIVALKENDRDIAFAIIKLKLIEKNGAMWDNTKKLWRIYLPPNSKTELEIIGIKIQ